MTARVACVQLAARDVSEPERALADAVAMAREAAAGARDRHLVRRVPVQLAWSKEMVPGTDVVSGRRPGLWPEVAASDEATAAGVQTSV